jgi:hypothetical protein
MHETRMVGSKQKWARNTHVRFLPNNDMCVIFIILV